MQAYNLYGTSKASDPGNGAVIGRTPDPPRNLQEDETQRSSESISFFWETGFDGGAVIVDYRILYDEGFGSSFKLLAEGVT